MTTRHRAEGFIFKVRNRSEADRIFSVFTKEGGRMELFAKAVRKINSKLRGGTELFSVSEIEFIQGRTKKTLTDAMGVERFEGIKQDPEKFVMAQGMARIIDEFIRGQDTDEKIFHFLNEMFRRLETVPSSPHSLYLLYMYFFWNFVALLGYHPQLHACSHCHAALEPKSLHFSAAEGGVICSACARGRPGVVPLSVELVKIVRIIVKKEWDVLIKLRFDTKLTKALAEISKIYYKYLLATHGETKTEQ